MGASIAGLLILAVFLASTLMSLRTSLFGNLQVSDAAKASTELLGDQVRTVIGVTSTVVDGVCGLAVELENTGATTIRRFSEMDVIVQFPTGINLAVAMVYSAAAPNVGQFTVTTISGLFEPGNWNPGENLTIDAQIPLIEPGNGLVTISAPNGITAEAQFSGLVPC